MSLLIGVPGKLKTLLTRLTATRAGYIDDIYSDVTTLHDTRLTSARAAKLDDIAAPYVWKSQKFTSDDTWTCPSGVEAVLVRCVGAEVVEERVTRCTAAAVVQGDRCANRGCP